MGQFLKAIKEHDKSFFDKEYDNNGNTVLHYLAGLNNTSAIRRIEELKFLNDILNRKTELEKHL